MEVDKLGPTPVDKLIVKSQQQTVTSNWPSTKGSGYDPLIAYGNRGLHDQIIFDSGWGTQGIPLKQIISETEDLCRNDTIRKKWMYENAAHVLGID